MLLSIHSWTKSVCRNTKSTITQLTSSPTMLQRLFPPSFSAPLRGRVKRLEVVQRDCIKSGTFTTVSSVCSHVSFAHTVCNWITLLKCLSVVPCCSSPFPSDLQRMSNVIAWPSSSGGMLMELFGSLPLEAGGMDLFHLMSVRGSGGERRITGWHCFNCQDGSKRKDTMRRSEH